MQKVLLLDQAITVIQNEKRDGKRIVLAGGVFDILHIGHLRFLEEAKKQGDILLVAIEPDSKVKKLKGMFRPIHDEQKRAYMLASLRSVDYVVILPEMTTDQQYFTITKMLAPDVIAVTEGDSKLSQKRKQVKAIAGELVVVTSKIPTPSTSQLLKLLSLE